MGYTAAEAAALSAKLAAFVTCTRERFEQIYDATLAGGGAAVRGEPFMAAILDAAFQSPTDKRVAFTRAFQAAFAGNWHRVLMMSLLEQKAIKRESLTLFGQAAPAAAAAIAAPVAPIEEIVPQAILDLTEGIDDPLADVDGILRTIPKVCHVRIEGGAAVGGGSGFLVGPQSVMTAWHVIAPLVDKTTGREATGSHKKLKVVFDHFARDEAGRKLPTRSYDVVENWLGENSRCHDSEVPSKKGIDVLALKPEVADLQHLDFAVIRLKGSPGRERGVVPLRDDYVQVPTNGGVRLRVFQHPNNLTQGYSRGQIFELFGNGEPPARMRHRANTAPGSSGGLCTDHEFKCIGLHQATVVNGNGETVANQAVPVAHIVRQLEQAFEVDPELEPLWQLDDTRLAERPKVPLIGRENFQSCVWQVARGAKRIVSVRGARRTGQSFSTQILKSLLASRDVVIVELTADQIGRNAIDFATRLLTLTGGELPPGEKFPEASGAATTVQAWLRNQLLPDLVKRMHVASGGRTVWIVIDHLDRFDMPEDDARSLLLALMAASDDASLLRFLVLIGDRNPFTRIPSELIADDTNAWPNQTEMEIYVRRYCIANEIPITRELVEKYTKDIMKAAARDDAARADQWQVAADFLMSEVHPELLKRK